MLNEPLYRSRDLAVTFARGHGHDVLLVTFDCYTSTLTLDRPGFGEAFFRSRSIDAIHIISRDNLWYQDEDLPAALETVRVKALSYGRVLTYGSSMGGYAAIRFAARIGASTAIAVAPQYSIDLAITPFDCRWNESNRILFLNERPSRISAIHEAIVFYDPHVREDRLHVDMIAQDTPVTRVRVPYAGHSTGLYLSELHLMGESVIDIIEGRFNSSDLERIARRRRREVGKYFDNLASLVGKRRPALALHFARLALERRADNSLYRHNLAEQLTRNGLLEEAEIIQRSALERDPHSLPFLKHLITILGRRGALDQALIEAEKLVELGPDNPDNHHYLADVHAKRGNLSAAAEAERMAVLLDPRTPHFSDTLRAFESALGLSVN